MTPRPQASETCALSRDKDFKPLRGDVIPVAVARVKPSAKISASNAFPLTSSSYKPISQSAAPVTVLQRIGTLTLVWFLKWRCFKI